MSTADSTAIVAVIIAVIAFFVTTAQLLQALFGTAEGYRRCQSSVIGDWASETKRKFRWSELRFETIFSTPDIRIQRRGEDKRLGAFITGDISSREMTLVPQNVSHNDQTDDCVRWLMLLRRLHDFQRSYSLFLSKTYRPTPNYSEPKPYPPSWRGLVTYVEITVRTRSWDFMPPDIVRPFASSTVGDIISIAHRLGMQWKDLRLGESIMRAEGNGQSISSTSIRSFGILLQYTNGRSPEENFYPREFIMVCSNDADKFGFGIIPGFSPLGMRDIRINDAPEPIAVMNAMKSLGIEDYSKNFQYDGERFKNEMNYRGFFDLVPLVSPWIPQPQSTVVQIRNPFKNYHRETVWWGGFPAFRQRLQNLSGDSPDADTSPQIQWVLEKYGLMHSRYPSDKAPSWEEQTADNVVLNGRDLYFLDDLFGIWRECTGYLLSVRAAHGSSFYSDLVAAQIATAVVCPTAARNEIDAHVTATTSPRTIRWKDGPARAKYLLETMHLYIDNLPKIVEFMADRGFEHGGIVREAWWTMMLRALCWHRSVVLVDQDPSSVAVPCGLYYSKTPVYIA